MKVQYKGQKGIVRKEEFYCKAGAYTHKERTGWVLEIDGKIVLGNRLYASNRCAGADRHDYPEFQTRKHLLWTIEEDNKDWKRRQNAA